jgi:RNA polymerase sigma-70 factor, ECF subfamily
VRDKVEAIYRAQSRRVFATLVRLLGDFDLAEEALHEAFRAALEQWPKEGVPDNPRAWLVSAGRFKAIDHIRRQARFDALDEDHEERIAAEESGREPDEIEDDRLRLVFTCCHPALAPDAQVALTLREVCGLTTEEIARAFLSSAPTVAQRIVRAKGKIRDAKIPYQIPARADLPDRLDSVLHVIYLVFNEGYAAAESDELIRHDLCAEAIRLGRVLRAVMADEPEIAGLLGLMLLHDARREGRTDEQGEIVLLEEQDRSLWDRAQIHEGLQLTERSLGPMHPVGSRPPGPYALQAAIAACHATATSAERTDWARIQHLYDWLLMLQPSPVIALNRAVALAMARSPEDGLAAIDAIEGLDGYLHMHTARGDLLERAGRPEEAMCAFERALELTESRVERAFIERRLAALRQASVRTGEAQ